MDYEKLKEAVDKVHGSTFLGLDTETQVKLKGGKKNPMQGRVTKVTEGANTMIFSNVSESGYANMVKRRMEKEGKDPSEFEVKPRAWGERIQGTPFVDNKGKKYIECFFISPGKSYYLLDGEPVNKDEIEGLPESRASNDKSQGEIETKVVVRTYSLDSIKNVRIQGEDIS